MFNGFFSVFGLNSINFTYQLGDGTTLFDNVNTNPSVSNPILQKGSLSSVAMAYVPNNFQWWGAGSAHERKPTTYITGFFGPGVTSSNTLCYDPAGTVGGGYTDSAHTSSLQWTPSLTNIASAQAGILTGGMLKTTTPCMGGANEFNSYLYLRSGNADNGDSALNFKGPFEAQTNGYLGFTLGSPVSVNWNLLPGTLAAIDGIEVFYSTNAAYTGANAQNTDLFPFSNHNGHFYCDQLLSNSFQSAGVVYSGNSLNLPAAITAATPVEVIACPFKKTSLLSRRYGGSFAFFQSGVAASPNQSGAGALNQLALVSLASPPTLGTPVVPVRTQTTMSCMGYYLQAVDSRWNAVATPTTPTISMAMAGATGAAGFYPSSSCASAMTSVQLDANGSAIVYMKMPSVTGNYPLSLNAPMASGLSPSWIDFAFAQTAAPSAVVLLSSSATNMVAGQCYEWDFEFFNGAYPTTTGSFQFNAYLTAGSGSFHFLSDCSDASLVPWTTPSSTTEHVLTLYFKPNAVGSGNAVFTTTTSAAPVFIAFNVGDSTPAQIKVFTQGGSGPCFPLGFEVDDNAGARLDSFASAYPLGLNAGTGLTLFLDSSCVSTPYNSLNGLSLSSSSSPQVYATGVGNLLVSQVSSLGGGPYVLALSTPPPQPCDAAFQLTSVMMDYSSGAFTQPNACTAQDSDLSGSGWKGITANSNLGMGSFYWEFSIDVLDASAALEFSIATPGVAQVLDQSSGSPGSGAATFVWNPGNGTGLCWANGGWTGSCGVVLHQGDIVGIAVTVTASNTQIWMSQNGSWIGSLPPTGSALLTLAAGTSITPAVLMTSPAGGPATQVTLITNQTLFHSTLPLGFSPAP